MFSLLHLHIIAFLLIFINTLIFNKNVSNNLGSKYFLINYIYHHHKRVSCFIIIYPFLIILIYFLAENIFPITTFFISILHVYFLHDPFESGKLWPGPVQCIVYARHGSVLKR